MDDDIIDDAALATLDRPPQTRPSAQSGASRQQNSADGASKKVVQPKPQNLGARASASAILVSPRQKGNPILNNIRSVGWEYSDIPADFVLGATTCALFLSLQYHRLHPEYIYSRIKALGGRYNLRVLLTLVDIENHEDPLKELSKTSLINNVTVILCWSSAEGGRYLELYKNYELAAPTSIKGNQSTTYSDQLVDFVTVPRGINKTDAVSLVSNFGSVRTAVNARPEEIALIGGWGEKKVARWCNTVRQPFRTKRATRRGLMTEESSMTPALSRQTTRVDESTTPALSRIGSHIEGGRDAAINARLGISEPLPFSPPTHVDDRTSDADKRTEIRIADDYPPWEPGAEDEEALAELSAMGSIIKPSANPTIEQNSTTHKRKPGDDDLSEGVAAALSKLRKS